MGWLGNLLKKIGGAPAEDLIFVRGLPMPGLDSEKVIERDAAYVELYIESMRLERARVFATKFQGVVYSFVTLARQGEANSVIAAVSKPAKLAELDGGSLGKVITVEKQMMGAVPWRGGNLGVELGLFSVKAGNVLTPMINFVTKVSDAAGISFVGAAKPFLPLITDGMDLIAGQSQDTALEVGVDTSIELKNPMACAIIAAPKGSFDVERLSIDPVDHKLLLAGEALKFGYCLFSIRATDRKSDYGEIPELKEKYAAFREAVVVKGIEKDAKDALTVFRRAALFSPDLIPDDARKIVATAEELMKDAFGGGAISASAGKAKLPAEFAAFPLYE